MGLFDGLFKKNEDYVSPYAPSEKGEERKLYFLSDLGTVKIGHQLEDASRNTLYEAVYALSSPRHAEQATRRAGYGACATQSPTVGL